jgi:hypothetical protein
MTRMTAWFRAQAAREGRAVAVEEALIGGRFWPYAVYRLRYFVLQYLVAVAVQGGWVILLHSTVAHSAFLHLLVLQAAGTLATSFWWGGLEVMRSEVRRLRQTSRPAYVSNAIQRWLLLAIVIAVVVVAGGAVGTVAARSSGAVQQLYVLAIALRVALCCVTQTFHSGVYAVRRIYRPAMVIAGVEMLGLGLAVMLRGWFGPPGLPSALIASNLVAAGCSLYYSHRAYRFLDIHLFAPSAARWRLPRRFDRIEFAAAGLSFAVSRLDAFLVLVLFAGPAFVHDTTTLPVLFALISPTVRAGFDWARLFYFDLKRLDLLVYSRMLDQFAAHLRQLALALGLLFGSIAIATAYVASPTTPDTTVWLLLPFFLSRAFLGCSVIRCFSARRYALLLGAGCACLAGLLIVRTAVAATGEQLLFLSALLLATAALLELSNVFGERTFPSANVQWLSQWLWELARLREPVRVGSVVLTPDVRSTGRHVHGRQTPQALAAAIARRLGSSGAAARIAPRQVVWYQRGTGPSLTRWVPIAAGGLIENVRETGVHSDGRTALSAATRSGLLAFAQGSCSTPRWTREVPGDVEDLDTWLKARMPCGIFFRPSKVADTALASVSASVSVPILKDALRFARDLGGCPSQSAFDVSSIWVAGQLYLMCALPRSLNGRLRLRWRLFVAGLNVQLALRTSPQRDARGQTPRRELTAKLTKWSASACDERTARPFLVRALR